MHKRAAVALAVLALCVSCQKFVEGKAMFRDLVALRDQIAAQYHEKVLDVNLSTKGEMTVKFINSPLNAASREAKQKRADEVAAFVTSHFKHPLTKVSTQFVSEAGAARVEETFVGR